MNTKLFSLLLATSLMTLAYGCKDKAEETKAPSIVKAPKPPKLDADALSTELPAQPVAAETSEPAPVPAEVQPVQDAVEAFKEKNNRYPNGIQELVEQKLIALPKLPEGKAFFVNPSTGRVVIGSNP